MAKRRTVPPPGAQAGDGPILPEHLADGRGLDGEDSRRFHAEQRAWFAAHGVDPGDWSAVHRILLASWRVHGVEDQGALERARLRAEQRTSGWRGAAFGPTRGGSTEDT